MKIRKGNRLERNKHRKEKEVKGGGKSRRESRNRGQTEKIRYVSKGEMRGKQDKRNFAERR